jgi:hypothetical protein
MKQKNREKRLRARVAGYDKLVKDDSKLASSYKRPGSMRR